MADEPNQPNEEEVVDTPDESPKLAEPSKDLQGESAQEETTEILAEVPEPIEEEETPEEGKEDEKPPSRREQLRIHKLLAKYGPPPERRSAPSQNPLDYENALDADPEVIQQLEADRRAIAQDQYQRGNLEAMQQMQFTQFYNNIRFDYPVVAEKMSKLDPDMAKALDDEYIAVTGANPANGTVRNPNIGYAEFVEARLEQAERLAQSMSANTAKNIAKQAATTGLRPDGSSAKRLNLNQAPEDMSMEELYAKIGQTPPKQ